MSEYVLSGLRISSALPLPELMPWTGPTDGDPDVTVSPGAVPEDLPDPLAPGPFVTVGQDGSILVRVEGLVRILIQDGRTVTVQVLNSADPNGWRLFLFGTALGYLCHQRGLFPLHAATLAIGEATVAFAGNSGAGKSTLALALVRRGHALLSDDVSVLRPHSTGAEVVPSYPRMKLWKDTLKATSLDGEGLPRLREGLEKFGFDATASFETSPRRLTAIVLLSEGTDLTLDRLSPLETVPLLQAQIYRWRIAFTLGRQGDLLRQSGLLAATVPVFRLTRPKRFTGLEPTLRVIEERLGA